jgi:pSer/pThr/pTyr-binding forkhead associated (FHA) protein
VLTFTPGDAPRIRRLAPDVTVTVNGEPVGWEPRPVRHGARIDLAGLSLLYGDVAALGSTGGFVRIPDELLPPGESDSAAPGVKRGGRLVELRTGRAFPIPDLGLAIGRDPSCDVALESKDVSRRHAVIKLSLFGYAVSDTSANGTYVNGRRVDGAQVLGPDDMVRVGTELFRFEVDAASLAPAADLARAFAPAPRPAPPASEAARRSDPALTLAPDAPALLAVLEVSSRGPLEGERFRIERIAAHLGRGTHNDVRVDDPSVSSTHATLLWKAGAWHVLDLDSTNGTFVDGERVTGERALRGACTLRAGRVELAFRPVPASR